MIYVIAINQIYTEAWVFPVKLGYEWIARCTGIAYEGIMLQTLRAREFVPENDITYLGNEYPLYLDWNKSIIRVEELIV